MECSREQTSPHPAGNSGPSRDSLDPGEVAGTLHLHHDHFRILSVTRKEA
jgi:hypothetical protein